jgi:hypothetical protein
MYLAYEIDPDSRKELLAMFPPKYPDVICHHVTIRFPVSRTSVLPDLPSRCEVIGYADSGDGVEALVVEIDGRVVREDGNLFHITHSLDRGNGKKPLHSNALVRKGFNELGNRVIFLVNPEVIS